VGLAPLGSFEAWSEIVRGALVWLGCEDTVQLLAAKNPDADADVGAHVQFLDALIHYPDGLTAADALARAALDTKSGMVDDPCLREAILELWPGTDLPTTRKLGPLLRKLKGKVRTISNGSQARLVSEGGERSNKARRWRVDITARGGHREHVSYNDPAENEPGISHSRPVCSERR
jgi:hypothetical protein